MGHLALEHGAKCEQCWAMNVAPMSAEMPHLKDGLNGGRYGAQSQYPVSLWSLGYTIVASQAPYTPGT